MGFLQRNWHIFLAIAGVAIAVPAAIGVAHYLQSSTALNSPADAQGETSGTVSDTSVSASSVDANVSPAEGQITRKLATHGRWLTSKQYGRVWAPNGVSQDWQPYTVGHWSYSDDDGWYWNSDEAWSDTYHYGRWYDDPSDGWVWVPGDEWAPSWVSWRQSEGDDANGGYYGWAPLPPEGAYGNQPLYEQPAVWAFVAGRFLTSSNIHRVIIPRDRNETIFRETTVVNNFGTRDGHGVNRGIDPRRIERVSRRPLPVFEGHAPAPLPAGAFGGRDRGGGHNRDNREHSGQPGGPERAQGGPQNDRPGNLLGGLFGGRPDRSERGGPGNGTHGQPDDRGGDRGRHHGPDAAQPNQPQPSAGERPEHGPDRRRHGQPTVAPDAQAPGAQPGPEQRPDRGHGRNERQPQAPQNAGPEAALQPQSQGEARREHGHHDEGGRPDHGDRGPRPDAPAIPQPQQPVHQPQQPVLQPVAPSPQEHQNHGGGGHHGGDHGGHPPAGGHPGPQGGGQPQQPRPEGGHGGGDHGHGGPGGPGGDQGGPGGGDHHGH